jgi:hypothetical protein
MIENGFLPCLFCGSARVFIMEIQEDEGGKRGLWPAAVSVLIECVTCQHQFNISIVQANEHEGSEQVAIGLYKRSCPETCTMPVMHQKD